MFTKMDKKILRAIASKFNGHDNSEFSKIVKTHEVFLVEWKNWGEFW